MSYLESFQAGLCIILVEGIVFLVLSVLNIREKIVDAIPLGIRLGIAPAIGLMLLNIGFGSNAGVSNKDGGMRFLRLTDTCPCTEKYCGRLSSDGACRYHNVCGTVHYSCIKPQGLQCFWACWYLP